MLHGSNSDSAIVQLQHLTDIAANTNAGTEVTRMAFVSNTARTNTFVERMRSVWADFADYRAKRRVFRETVAELSALSNRELADLGINRAEIRRIALAAAEGCDDRH